MKRKEHKFGEKFFGIELNEAITFFETEKEVDSYNYLNLHELITELNKRSLSLIIPYEMTRERWFIPKSRRNKAGLIEEWFCVKIRQGSYEIEIMSRGEIAMYQTTTDPLYFIALRTNYTTACEFVM